MIKQGVDINYKSGQPLREAITNNHQLLVCSLLDRAELKPELKDENGRTALHVAAWFNKEGATARLLSLGTRLSPNERDNQGNTAVLLAAKYGTRPGLEVLLSCPAVDLDIVDNLGQGLNEMVRDSWRLSTGEKVEVEELIETERG